MKRDTVYWIYRLRQLSETVQHLTESERKLADHNNQLLTANEMANNGHTSEEIHAVLQQSNKYYAPSALMHWYTHGGDLPIHNFIRKAAIHAFNMDASKLQQPHFLTNQIHDNVINKHIIKTLHDYHDVVKPVFESLPKTLTIYRGVGLQSNISGAEYKPHSLESWTTHLHTAKLFSNKSHLPNAIPHVFKATINKEDIFSSHHAAHLVPGVIPPEDMLEGKEEIIPFGDKIKNIERIV